MHNFQRPLKQVTHATLPLDHPMVRGRCINTPIYEQDEQWRLKIQPFSKGGFEAKAILVNRNAMSAMINANRVRGRRLKPKEKDPETQQRNDEKSANRAKRAVRLLCIEMGADRLLTCTSRNILTDYDMAATTWKRFIRLLNKSGQKVEYVAVPELHKNGKHYHIHAAINGFVRADLLRRCWQIALGGKGDERGANALGNIDIKSQGKHRYRPDQQALYIARYIGKYITKEYEDHHIFNRKRYWKSRSVKLLEGAAEWLQAETLDEAVSELFEERFDEEMAHEILKQGVFATDSGTPMIFFRFIPRADQPLSVPF